MTPIKPDPAKFKWGWRERFRCWRYNWIKRPFYNLVWKTLHPESTIKMGKMNRKNMEWAFSVDWADDHLERIDE